MSGWSSEQQRILAALGIEVWRHVDGQAPHTATLADLDLSPRLRQALIEAGAGCDLAVIAAPAPHLNEPAHRRAVWRALRPLRRR